MAQIRIDDDVYERLKKAAAAESRTVGQEIEYLLNNILLLEDIHARLADVVPSSRESLVTNEVTSEATKGVFNQSMDRKRQIPKLVNELQDKIDQADMSNQDPDYWDVIRGYKEEINKLWEEWHGLA